MSVTCGRTVFLPVHVVYRKELRGLGRCIPGARERICERPEYM